MLKISSVSTQYIIEPKTNPNPFRVNHVALMDAIMMDPIDFIPGKSLGFTQERNSSHRPHPGIYLTLHLMRTKNNCAMSKRSDMKIVTT